MTWNALLLDAEFFRLAVGACALLIGLAIPAGEFLLIGWVFSVRGAQRKLSTTGVLVISGAVYIGGALLLLGLASASQLKGPLILGCAVVGGLLSEAWIKRRR